MIEVEEAHSEDIVIVEEDALTQQLLKLFMANTSIKHLSWLTAPPSNFTLNIGLPISTGNNPPQCLLPSHEGQKISVLRIFNSKPNSDPKPQMMSRALATSSEPSTRVSSSRYQA